MAAEVDVLASEALRPDELDGLAAELTAWGLAPRMLRMPRRRGAAELSWLLMLSIPAEIMAKVLLERLGAELYDGLRTLVERLVRGRHGGTAAAPRIVVVESADTGAQFMLRSDLPIDAYHQLVEEIASDTAGPGRWAFDERLNRWHLSAVA